MYSASVGKIILGFFLTFFLCIVACDNEGPTNDDPPVETLVLLTPSGGEVFYLGDTVPLCWEYRNSSDDIFMTVPKVSLNNGIDFKQIHQRYSVHNTPQGDTTWVIPSDSSYLSEEAMIMVYHYSKIDLTDVSKVFSIRSR